MDSLGYKHFLIWKQMMNRWLLYGLIVLLVFPGCKDEGEKVSASAAKTEQSENKPMPGQDIPPSKPEHSQNKRPNDAAEIDLAKVYFNGPTVGTVFAKVDNTYVGIRVLDDKRSKMEIYDAKSNLEKKYAKAIENRTIELTFNKQEFITHDGKTLTVTGPVIFVPSRPENEKNWGFTTDDPLLFEMVQKKNIHNLPNSFSVKFK